MSSPLTMELVPRGRPPAWPFRLEDGPGGLHVYADLEDEIGLYVLVSRSVHPKCFVSKDATWSPSGGWSIFYGDPSFSFHSVGLHEVLSSLSRAVLPEGHDVLEAVAWLSRAIGDPPSLVLSLQVIGC